jgi:Ca-activated chloride channel family protein
MDLIPQLHFLRPLWLLALPLLWGLVIWLARRRNADGDWQGLIDADLLPGLRLQSGGKGSRAPWPWLALAWTLAALAMAGPSWQQEHSAAFRGNEAWVVVEDLSPSMAATDVSPNRYTRARYVLDDLLTAAHDVRVGLVVFSDEPYTVTPLTDDVATIRALLPPLSPDIMPSAGDNLAPALEQAGQLLQHGGAHHGKIIVLSDGFDDPAAAFKTAEKLRAQGTSVYVVGIGTQSGAPLDQSGGGFVRNAQGQLNLARLKVNELQQLASSGGGRYAGLEQVSGLIGDLQNHTELPGEARVQNGLKVAHWLDGGIWLLPLLLVVTALLARRGWI